MSEHTEQASILETILAHKAHELAERKRLLPLEQLRALAEAQPPPRGFLEALRTPGRRVIAECKRASPSKGPMAPGPWAPGALARRYEAGGAACVSVLTDSRFFWGQLEDLAEVKAATSLPVLRKDFLIDPWQVWEARAAGADAVLLIAAAFPDDDALGQMISAVHAAGLDELVEVHDDEEAEMAAFSGARLVGINNRDLGTFEVDLSTTERLAPMLHRASCTVVSESGITGPEDATRLEEAGVRAFLVGERLVRDPDPVAALQALIARSGD